MKRIMVQTSQRPAVFFQNAAQKASNLLGVGFIRLVQVSKTQLVFVFTSQGTHRGPHQRPNSGGMLFKSTQQCELLKFAIFVAIVRRFPKLDGTQHPALLSALPSLLVSPEPKKMGCDC